MLRLITEMFRLQSEMLRFELDAFRFELEWLRFELERVRFETAKDRFETEVLRLTFGNLQCRATRRDLETSFSNTRAPKRVNTDNFCHFTPPSPPIPLSLIHISEPTR